MNGQWIGNIQGTNVGDIIINLESYNDSFQGVAILYDNNSSVLVAEVSLTIIDNNVQGKLQNFKPINPVTHQIDSIENFKNIHPQFKIPSYGKIQGKFSENKITGQWKTNIYTHGNFQISLHTPYEKSVYPSTQVTWHEFKELIKKTTYIKIVTSLEGNQINLH